MNFKTCIAAAALSIGLLPAVAQDKTGPHVGLVTAYNTSWVFDSKLFDDPNYKTRTTWNSAPFGVVLGYKVNPSSDFQIEISRTNMGAEYDIKGRETLLSEEKTVGEKRIETKYWSVPVLYKFTTGDKVRFAVQVGPQFSFLSEGSEVNVLNEKAYLKVNLESTDLAVATISSNAYSYEAKEYQLAEKEDFNKTDIGAVLGLGLEADITNNLYFSGNVRFYYGFTDIRSDDYRQTYKDRNNYSTRNNVTGGFQIGLHYRFDMR